VRALIQRVTCASVEVAGERVAAIDRGLLVLVGVGHGDGDETAVRLADKVARLRVFGDQRGRMNLSVGDIGGAVLAVSQFTLYGDVGRGNRPSFIAAADPESAARLVQVFVEHLRGQGLPVETGRFGADMRVSLVNDGPVTIWTEMPPR
jgi:D-aminoacyl-tRNA deacylase